MIKNYTLFFLLAGSAFGQVSSPPLIDFTLVGITRPMTMGLILPDICQDGQLFFLTSAPAGSNVFSCLDAKWTVLGNGIPPSILAAATSSTLGTVMIPDNSGLSVNSGAVSVIYGTGPNTAMAGDDSRVTGLSAVARSANYSDLRNPPIIPTNTNQLTNGALFLGPTSNAFSATKLAAAPLICATGRYAVGVTATGNATCAQVLYSQLGGVPAAYVLPQATGASLGGMVAGTGLGVVSGVVSAKYGTLAGTAAQGNDSRILGASQKASNLSDLGSVTTALANLKLTGASPATINSSTTGNAATATRATTAGSLQGSGPFLMKGLCGTAPVFASGENALMAVYLDSDCNLHLRDQPNLNRTVMVYTWKNGVEQKCDQSLGFSAFTDFSASGVPICTVAPQPPPPPSGITASGSSCVITAITNGAIMGASCTP